MEGFKSQGSIGMPKKLQEQVRNRTQSRQPAQPQEADLLQAAKEEEQAELALFLASNNSDFIVGQVIPFSGGWVTLALFGIGLGAGVLGSAETTDSAVSSGWVSMALFGVGAGVMILG